MVRVHVDDQMDSKSLLGAYVCTANPEEFVWQPGPLTQVLFTYQHVTYQCALTTSYKVICVIKYDQEWIATLVSIPSVHADLYVFVVMKPTCQSLVVRACGVSTPAACVVVGTQEQHSWQGNNGRRKSVSKAVPSWPITKCQNMIAENLSSRHAIIHIGLHYMTQHILF